MTTTPWSPGWGGPPASAGNKWARRRKAGCAPTPLPPAAVAPPTARFGAGPPAALLSACSSPGKPRAAGPSPSLRVSPPRSSPLQVRGRAEGGPAASARAGVRPGGAAEPEPEHPGESGRMLGDGLEQSASDGVGRAAGRPAGEGGGGGEEERPGARGSHCGGI